MRDDRFGPMAERLARFFGTPVFLLGMTFFVVTWVTLNSIPGIPHWDPYPFILLTLMLSLQASYAAPFILLADERQNLRDEVRQDRHDEILKELDDLRKQLEAKFNLE